jgi:parallel beta-helix repeat protein
LPGVREVEMSIARWSRFGVLGILVALFLLAFGTSGLQSQTSTEVGQEWQASADFGNTQGNHGWYYQEWNGSAYQDMHFDAASNRWQGSQPLCLLGPDWAHPDSGREPAREWVSPTAGTATITGNVHALGTGGGDGVDVRILKGSTELWAKTIAAGDATGYDFSLETQVKAGDAIYFRVSKKADTNHDSTFFNPSIRLVESAVAATPAAPTGPKPITVGASGCDFTTIQAAIDAAPDGGVIEVQTGSYKENLTIRNRDGLTLRGAGPDAVTLDGNGPEQKSITPGILILSSRNVTVAGLRITNSWVGLEADDTKLLFIEGSAFESNLQEGIYLLRSEARIAQSVIRSTQRDPIAGNRGDGIWLVGSSRATLVSNLVTGNADCGLRTEIEVGQNPPQVTGSGNTIAGNLGGDLSGDVSTSLLAQPLPEGTQMQVSVPLDVPTIQAAVDRVRSGGTIVVAAGTYQQSVQSGPVQIYKSLKIVGAGAGKTILQAPGPQWVAVNVATNGLNVTLEGLTVTGGRRGVQVNGGSATSLTLRGVTVEKNGAGKGNDFGLRVTGDVRVFLSGTTIGRNDGIGITVANGRASVQIDQSTIADNSLYGIYLQAASETSITSSQITGTRANADGSNGVGLCLRGTAKATARACTISGNRYGIYLIENSSADITDSSVAGSARYGIRIRDSARMTLTNSRVTGGTGDGSDTYIYGSGILVGDTCTATLQNCTVENNYMYGLSISGSAHVTIGGGAVRSNAGQGIAITGTTTAEITSCEVSGTKQSPGASPCCGSGVVARGESQVTIRGCPISGNAEAGVWTGDSATVSVSGSTISSNLNSGVDCSGTAHTTIQDNTISGNAACGIVASESAEVVISGNRITDTKKYTNGNLGRGIWALAQSKTTIRNNTITGSAEDGIRFGDGGTANETATTEISGNTIRGNANCGVRVDSDVGLKVAGQGNTIADNKNGNLCGTATKCPRGFGGGK